MLSTLLATDTRGLHLESAFVYPGVGNTLGGYALNRHSFTLVLATCSGAVPRIDTPSPRRWQHARGLRLELAFIRPSVGNTLGGCASNWHSFTPALATRSGATLNTRILVAIYKFGCRMSNTKVSPQLATLDGPVFVSSALCQENFHTYGMKSCLDGRIESLTLN
jgi:hypothetical protein